MDSKNRYGAPLFCSKNRPWRPNRFLDACWSPFGSLLAPFLAPFGLLLVPFGSFLPSFSLLSLLFGSLLGPLRALDPFSSLLACCWLPFATFSISSDTTFVRFFSLSLQFTLSQSFECETCSTVLFYTTTRIDLFSFRLLLSLKKRICWNTCRTHPQIIVGTPIYRNRSLRALPNCNLFTVLVPFAFPCGAMFASFCTFMI